MKFPKLYKDGANGKERLWQIWTDDDTVYETYGVVGGKMVDPGNGKQCPATNVGRANARSPGEQAAFVAESKWKKKVDGGYRPKCSKGKKMVEEMLAHKKKHGSNAKGGKGRDSSEMCIVDEIPDWHNVGIMKGPEYKGKHDVSDGGYVQPKYDGVRCKGSAVDGQGVITSSGANQFVFLSHIKRDLAVALEAFRDAGHGDVCVDGELYAHDIFDADGEKIKDCFNVVTRCCNIRASKPHEYEGQIKYYIFDIDCDLPQRDRLDLLKLFFKGVRKGSSLVMAPTYYVKSSQKMDAFLDYFIEEGYEGLIFRRREGEYIHKKKTSLDAPIFKYKKMQDAEFEVVGANQGTGRAKGKVIWVCVTEDGKEFKPTQNGTVEYCRELYLNREQYIGKMLTVKFQDYTKDGVPRFPIAKAFRDYE